MKKSKWSLKAFFFSFSWLFVLLVAVDFLTKWIVETNFFVGQSAAVIPGFFYITLSHNSGAAFSLGADSGLTSRIIFIIVSWAATAAIIYYYIRNFRKWNGWLKAIVAVIAAGAAGNGIDRTFYWRGTVGFDGVIDFMQFYIFGPSNQPFATFNVADSCLSVGIVMLIVLFIVTSIRGNIAKTPQQQLHEQTGSAKNADNGTDKETEDKK